MIQISRHACERYCERIEECIMLSDEDYEEIRSKIMSRIPSRTKSAMINMMTGKFIISGSFVAILRGGIMTTIYKIPKRKQYASIKNLFREEYLSKKYGQ